MTMFPDCRAKFTKDAYPYGGPPFRSMADVPEDEINAYWEKNLNDEHKRIVLGFDDAVDEIDYFFASIADTIFEQFGEYESSQINDAVMCDDRSLYDFSEDEIKNMNKQTYIYKMLHTELSRRVESFRNMMITTMIDHQICEANK